MKYTKEMHLDNLKRDINQVKAGGLLCEVTILGGNRCKQAIEINGTRMSFDEMIKNKPLPYKYCSRDPICICCYLFHPLRDENGKPLHRNKISVFKKLLNKIIAFCN